MRRKGLSVVNLMHFMVHFELLLVNVFEFDC